MTSTVCTTTDKTFEKEVLKSDKPVVVDFGAKWCGPCKKVSPIVDTLAEEMKDTIRIFKMDIEKSPSTAEKYEITCVPTLMIFKDGKLIDTKEGFMSKSALSKWIKEKC